jgi:hypothetical protein
VREHFYVTFSNPFVVCDQCGQPVPQWHDPFVCGGPALCDEPVSNQPCGHVNAGAHSTCPSWLVVDGCQCKPVCESESAVVVPAPETKEAS